MCGRMVDIQSATAENRRGKTRKKIETTVAKYNGLPYWAAEKKTISRVYVSPGSAETLVGTHARSQLSPVKQCDHSSIVITFFLTRTLIKTRMWANAQRDGRPVAYRWRPLFNAAQFG